MLPLFELKDYQLDTLAALRAYLTDVAATGDPNMRFYERTGVRYEPPPPIAHVPFICLRVPTGGGKTILAAHAIPIAAQTVMRTDAPVTIWFTPSTTIRDQTLNSLRDRAHPNRRALAAAFGENVRIMDTEEALHARRPDYDGGAVVIVSTIQAFRADNMEGRKVYDANGDLMDHFSGLPHDARADLERDAQGGLIYSLANVFRLRRPLIIADEAHNMSTQLSFATLARLTPSAIIEFTATPTKHSEQDEAKGKYASNVLHHVSAAELKAADMIKMPVVLRGRPDPRETIADALARLARLHDLARAEEAATREFIRPVMLLQAEAESKNGPTITPEVLKNMLIENFQIPEAEVAISTGKLDELDGVDLFDRDCKIRFIVTQQKLREGWDCSFAYVLCSIAPQKSERSVEQLLGRILRLPHAKRKAQEELNTAFAFATTTSFQETARLLTEGLVANGFERIEAEYAVRPPPFGGFGESGAEFRFEEAIPDDLDPAPVKARIEAVTGGRITFDLAARKIVAREAVSRADRLFMEEAWPQGGEVIDALQRRSWGWLPAEPERRVSFVAPGLAVRTGAGLEIFEKAHFVTDIWPLETCDPSPILDAFADGPSSLQSIIDVGSDGRLTREDAYISQLNLFGPEVAWSRAALIRWLDRRLGERSNITPASSRLFIGAALDVLMARRGMTIEDLGRARFRLQPLLVKVIAQHRRRRELDAWNAALSPQSGLDFITDPDVGFVFDTADVADFIPREPYRGAVKLKKHLFPEPDDLKPSGEETDCAIYIDTHPSVRVWFRNPDKRAKAFWLQTSSDKFYPDFLVELDDGRILAVEYKGENHATSDDSREKRRLGELWAEKSGGRCVFIMVEARNFAAIDRAIRQPPPA